MVMEILPDERLQIHIQAIKEKRDTPPQPRMMLFLDTATKYTGYSVFHIRQNVQGQPAPSLHQYGLFKASKGDWQCRCLELTSKIRNFIRQLKPGVLVMEYPTFQAGSAGMAAARSGGTLELAYLCGRLTVAWEFHITKVMADTGHLFNPAHLVTFRDWNGQLPKEITCQRCEEKFGIHVDNARSIENNFTDAIMLGKWFIEQSGKVSCMKGDGSAKREDF